MKPYLLIYENGNGYQCNCCRTTWTNTETMEFENDEKAKTFAEKFNQNNDRERDSEITSLYVLKNINPIFRN